jgi:2-keto-4-pentenoate hydratase
VIPDRDRYAPGVARQLAALRAAQAAGMPRCGWKVGINVPEVLAGLGLTHPGVAWLDGRRRWAHGEDVPCPAQALLHVEPELCLELGDDVPAAADAEAAGERIAGVAPAIELVDYAQAGADLDAIVAHGMFHHGLVAGARHAPGPHAWPDAGRPLLEVAGRRAEPPRADLVPRPLGELVAFAARFLAAFGEALRAGDLLLSGSFCARAARVRPGERVRADFGRLGLVAFQLLG